MNGHGGIFALFTLYGNTVLCAELILQALVYIAYTDLPEEICRAVVVGA
jgi:hypothetical protein